MTGITWLIGILHYRKSVTWNMLVKIQKEASSPVTYAIRSWWRFEGIRIKTLSGNKSYHHKTTCAITLPIRIAALLHKYHTSFCKKNLSAYENDHLISWELITSRFNCIYLYKYPISKKWKSHLFKCIFYYNVP